LATAENIASSSVSASIGVASVVVLFDAVSVYVAILVPYLFEWW
jgi:hypothetical protein